MKNTSAQALDREHMPTDFDVSLDTYLGRDTFGDGHRDGEQRIPTRQKIVEGPAQSMRGFEDTYRNIVDYIVRITHRIWEERNIDYIGSTYSANSEVYDDFGLQRGNVKIIQDTRDTTGAFSDIELIADEVIWAGNDDIGFHTSHRLSIRGTNDGDSVLGPATHANTNVMVIANCVVLENEIFLEHVLYNNSAKIQQLGLDLNETAAKMAAEPPTGWPRKPKTWDNLRRAACPEQPLSTKSPIEGFDIDGFVRNTFDLLWNDRNFEALSLAYAECFQFVGPTNRTLSGIGAYRDFLEPIIGAFPDLHCQVDEVYWMGNDQDGYLSAERWSATGTHLHEGLYGAPSGAAVELWGITQHKIIGGQIVREWMLFNELDLLMQIAAARQ